MFGRVLFVRERDEQEDRHGILEGSEDKHDRTSLTTGKLAYVKFHNQTSRDGVYPLWGSEFSTKTELCDNIYSNTILCNNIVVIYGNNITQIDNMADNFVVILFTILSKSNILLTVLLQSVDRTVSILG